MHGAAVALVAAALGTVPAPAAPPSAPSLLPSGKTYTVTLLTGDVVTVTGKKSGCPTVSVLPAAKSEVLSRSCGPDGHVRVVPAEVAPLLGTVLDRDLFDVTTLIANGYDDAHTKDLPLIVRPGTSAARTAAPLLTGAHSLPSLSAVAGRRAKKTGAELIDSLTAGGESLRSAAAPSKVWLDRKVHATALDPNLTQISAPQAWSAGYTGIGAKVAVLDTGVDPTHPDLAGQIAASKDFTVDGGDAVDHFGHGTHVAATIAGTGAASAGERKGVAPGAKLVIGKVLDDEGEGSFSQVIAGMEWAATQARVVNMSFGDATPSDGQDPLSLALDALSDSTGTLFVVAAGNEGEDDSTVSSPGAADRALTVGAVDGDDKVASFSSRGPLVGTHAAKPDLVAPGVDIVAARAAGTTLGPPVDANYVRASGTSMATPHVAGAAAVLAQRHPDWNAQQLKAALVGSADPIAEADPFTSGAGRLDVARALSGVVAGPAKDSTLSWVNTRTSAAAVTLAVTVSDRNGVAAPAGVATLSANSLTLAAGATGSATLTIDKTPLAARPGFYSALVTAKVGRTVIARTPVAFQVEAPSYDLTVQTNAIPGTPDGVIGDMSVHVTDIDDPTIFSVYDVVPTGDPYTVRVPAGRYSVLVLNSAGTRDDQRMALSGDPDVTISADTTMRYDLAKAEPLTASVPGVDTSAQALSLTFNQMPRRGVGWWSSIDASGDAAKAGNVFALPVDGVGVGTFWAYGGYGLRTANGDVYDLVRDLGDSIPADLSYQADPSTLARIDQHFHQVDMPNPVTRNQRHGIGPDGIDVIFDVTDPGAAVDRTDYLSPGIVWSESAGWNGDIGGSTLENARTYLPGSRQEKTWLQQPLHADWYDGSGGGCAPTTPFRTRGHIHFDLTTMTDQHDRFDCLGWGFAPEIPVALRLERNGALVGTSTLSVAGFDIPREAADYRLTYDVDASAVLPVSTHTSTAWTFRSTGPSGTENVPLPLLSVDYNLPLDKTNHPEPSSLATFTVRQLTGATSQKITAFTMSASLDGGTTWQPYQAERVGDGVYQTNLPQPAAGQTISLKVTAKGSAGSGIEQTIIDAYRPAA